MSRRPVVTDASDEDQIEKARKAEAAGDGDLEVILKSENGRRWLYNLAYETCHYGARSHVAGDPDSSAFNEGGRSVGIAVLDQIKDQRPDMYMKMMEENHG